MSEETGLSNQTASGSKNLLSVKEAAAVSSYTTAHVTRLAQKGAVKAIRDGRQWMIDASSLRQFVREIEARKEIRRNKLRQERVEELSTNTSDYGLSTKLSVETTGVFNRKAFNESLAFTFCVVLVFLTSLVFVETDLKSWTNKGSVENGAERLAYDFEKRIVPESNDLAAASLLAQPFYDTTGKVLENVWCAAKMLWYRFDTCVSPAIEYALVPARYVERDMESPAPVVNNTYVTNEIYNSGIREVVVSGGLIDPGIFVTQQEYKNQVDAIMRSIESIDGGSTVVSSGASALEDLSDIASMTESTGDLLVWNGTAWTNISTSSLGIVGTGAVDSVNGQIGNVTLDTGDIAENGNLYFTDLRARSALSETITGIDYGSGVFSLTAGYSIPLIASTTQWQTAYSWGNHSLQGYLTSITGESLEDLSDVASMSQNQGDLLYWNGTTWTSISTSSLGIVGSGGGAVDSVNGQTGVVVLDSGDISENGNLYFTNARADARIAAGTTTIRNMISETVTGLDYASGVLSLTAGYSIPLTASTTEWANTRTLANLLNSASSTWNNTSALVSASSSSWTTAFNIVNASSTFWDQAYSWGNHASVGYLTTESDPVFSGSAAFNISGGDITAWNAAAASTTALTPAYIRSLFSAGTGLSYSNGQFTNTGVTSIGGLTGAVSTSSLGLQIAGNYLLASNNLSDLTSSSTARTNLGLGTLATQDANNVLITGGNAVFQNATTTNLSVIGDFNFGLSDGCVESVGGVLTSTGSNCGTGSGGITSLNGLTSSSQDFLTATSSGLNLVVNSAAGDHTFTLGLMSGYSIPLTASTTEWSETRILANLLNSASSTWNNTSALVSASSSEWQTGYSLANILNSASSSWNAAAASTTALTPAYIRGLWSETVTGLSYNSGTGILSLDGSYNIPLTASTTEWDNTRVITNVLNSASSTWNNSSSLVSASSSEWGSAYVLANLLNSASSSWNAAAASTTALTPAYIRGLFSGTSPISYNNTTGTISFDFGTNNTWTGINNFATTTANTLTVSGQSLFGTTTLVAAGANGAMRVASAHSDNYIQVLTDNDGEHGLTYRYAAANNRFEIFSDYYSGGSEPYFMLGTYSNRDQITLATSSNVGIGTTTPSSKLTVTGDIFATGAFRDTFNASGTSGMILSSTGTGTSWISTSSLGYLTSISTTTVRNMFSSSATSLTYDSGTGDISLTAGYVIPLSASTTQWATAYASTTALTPSYIRGLFSETVAGLDYSAGVISLTSGYIIPLSASTTEWTNFYNTPSTRITAGTGLSWSGNTLNASSSADINYWTLSGGNVYRATGNVGIGSTTPSAALSINGFDGVGVGAAASSALAVYGGTGASSTSQAGAGGLIILKAGTGGLQTGFVGNGGVGGTIELYGGDGGVADSGGGHGGNVFIAPGNGGAGGIQGSAGRIVLGVTKSGTVLGNVGVGTSTPSSKLTIAGDLFLTGAFKDSTNATGTLGQILWSTGTSTRWVSTSTLGIVGGIASLNGQTGTAQTFATGTATGIGLTVTSNSNVHTFTPTISSGYSIPLTASTTQWATAYASTTALTPSYIRGLFSETATGLDYSAGVISLTSGYVIPLSASTTEWTNFYNSPSTRIITGTGLSWSGNTLNASSTSEINYWTLAGGNVYRATGNVGIGTSTPNSALTVVGNITATGTLAIQGTGTSTFGGDIQITGDIVPSADDTYSLGSLSRVWRDVYIGPGSLYVNGKKVIQDISDTITISTDADQNLMSQTSGVGVITMRATGSGNANVTTGSGNINITSTSGNVNIGTTGSGQLNLGTVTSGVWHGTDIDISDYTNLGVSGTGLSLSGDTIALTAGYAIPLSASTTEWSTAYGWGNHALVGYLTDITGESLEDLSDVASMTQVSGDLLYWNGAAWSNLATSSLGLTGHDAVTLAGEDYLSLSGQQITALAINPDNLAATDFGDFTCNGTTCSFDANTIADNEIDYTQVTLADFTNDAGFLTNITGQSFYDLADVSASGSNNRILYQNGGLVVDSSDFLFNSSTNTLTVGGLSLSDALTIHTATSTTIVPNNQTHAWVIATSTNGSPLFRIDTTSGSESVVIGGVGDDIYIGDVGAPANLVFEESSTIHGQGGNTLTFGTAGDIINFAVNTGFGTSTPSSALTVAGDLFLTGAFKDSTNATGTLGQILWSTGTSTRWVSTSTLGIVGGIASLNGQTGTAQTFATGTATGIGLTVTSNSNVHTFTPTISSGYSIPLTASTTEWSTAYGWGNHASAGYLSVADVDTSSELLSILTDETGTGSLVFGTSPTFAGTPVFGGGFLNFSTSTRAILPNNSATAFTFGTTTTGASLFTIDTTSGNEKISLGTGSGEVLIGNIGAPTDLVFEESSTIHGQGGNTLTFGTVGDIINFAVNTGFGTSTPSSALTVAGDFFLAGGFRDGINATGTLGQVLWSTGTSTRWVSTSTLGISGGSSVWSLNGSDAYYTNGNVGIGTSSPTARLDITKASVGDPAIVIREPSGVITLEIRSQLYSSTFIGAGSGQENLTGDYNTGLGRSALMWSTTGSSNTAVGANTLASVGFNGSNNTALGAGALILAGGNQNRNTAVGSAALGGWITGSENTSLGFWSGINIGSGSGNLVLGTGALVPDGNADRQLSIGNLIFGQLPATTTEMSLNGLDLTGRVSIGTSTLPASLLVWGSGTGTGKLFMLANNASTTVAQFLDDGTGYFSGNIGIGTTTPGSKLAVAGDLFLTGAFKDYTNSAGTAGMVLLSTGSGTQWVSTSSLGISGGTGTSTGGMGNPAFIFSSSTVGTTTVNFNGLPGEAPVLTGGTLELPSDTTAIVVEVWGAGAGGYGGGNGGAGSGGGTSCFGTNAAVCSSPLLQATGGNGVSAGGSGSGGDINLSGGYGAGAQAVQSGVAGYFSGGVGGSSPRGGSGGTTGHDMAGGAGGAFGGGGSGGGYNGGSGQHLSGRGGGAGGYSQKIILSPSSNYYYTIGAGGSGGTAGTNGLAGGAGGAGGVVITVYTASQSSGSSGGVASSSVAFSVSKIGSTQSIADGTVTQLTFDNEVFDTNNNFDLSTESFTPTVAGKYILSANVFFDNLPANSFYYIFIRKNGATIKQFIDRTGNATTDAVPEVTTIVEANGTTDSFDVAVRQINTGSAVDVVNSSTATTFSGALLAPANATAGGWSNDGTQSYVTDYADLVAIGTTTAAAKLHVWGTSGSTTDLFRVASSTGTGLLNVAFTGNVGIGTTTASSKLTIVGTAGNNNIFTLASSTGASLLTFTSTGRLGIGTTTPSQALTVVGDIFATGYLRDSLGNAGSIGQILQATATGTQWVATSTLGFAAEGGGGGMGNPAFIFSSSTAGTTTVNFTGLPGEAPVLTGGVLELPSDTTAIVVEVWGAGGGGGSAGGEGNAGGNTCFGTNSTACATPILTATGGGGGGDSSSQTRGVGGTGTGGDLNLNGGYGSGGSADLNYGEQGGYGGSSPRGGEGGSPSTYSGSGATGGTGEAFGGGGGGANRGLNTTTSAGGGGGGYSQKILRGPSGNYYYAIGAGGAPGASTPAGGAGGAGGIVITVYTASQSSGGTGGVASSSVAFSVHKNGTNQTGITPDSQTLLTWNTEVFDTNNNFASNRFTPTVSGKYMVTLNVRCVTTSTYCQALIYKNGSVYSLSQGNGQTGGYTAHSVITALVDMNGTTDYLEGYVLTGAASVYGESYNTNFSGALLAPANATAGGWSNDGTQSYITDYADLVAIGTSTAAAKLDIWGNSGSQDILAISSSTGSRLLTFSSAGNLSIGTTSSAAKLTVQGSGDLLKLLDVSGNTMFLVASSTNATSTLATNLHVQGNLRVGTSSLFLTNDSIMFSGTSGLRLSGGKLQFKHEDSDWADLGTGSGGSGSSTSGARLVDIKTYTSNDTWTKPNDIDYVVVKVVGGGGAGGGAASTSGGEASAGAGGAAGGASEKHITAASLGGTETITVGAGGSANSGSAGGNGATSSFGSHLSATGGAGGVTIAAGSTQSASAVSTGGAGSGGDINTAGGGGSAAWRNPGGISSSGAGGNSIYGAGAPSQTAAVGGAGIAGGVYGAGGSGAVNAASQSARSGGAGGAGVVIVYEYELVTVGSGAGGMGNPAFVFSSSTAGSNIMVNFTGLTGESPVWNNGTLELPSDTTAIVVEVWGAGGGGGGGGETGNPGGNGGNGGSSCFGTNATACSTPMLSATGGTGGEGGRNGGQPGVGGAGSGGDINLGGGGGAAGNAFVPSTSVGAGGTGGNSPRGGAGGRSGFNGFSGGSGGASGGGGGGGGYAGAGTGPVGGAGGAAGGYSQEIIRNPSGAYYYTIGTAGTAGTAGGANGYTGGTGGAGGIVITIYTSSQSSGYTGGIASSSVAFSVHKNGNSQTVTAATYTTLTWDAELFDTNNNFDLSTERFTPTVAGKYIVTINALCASTTDECLVAVYKNGSAVARTTIGKSNGSHSGAITHIVDMNGTTDYLEAVGYTNSTTISGDTAYTNFSGALIAPAQATAGGWSNDGTQSYVTDYADLIAIGTSTAAAKLDIWGNAGSQDILNISSSTGARLFTVAANGNVGIGTTMLQNKLSVFSTDTVIAIFSASSSNSSRVNINASGSGKNAGLGLSIDDDVKWTTAAYLANGTNYDYTIWNSQLNSSAIHVDGDTSNVGIGTTDPLYKLHVSTGTSTLANVPWTSDDLVVQGQVGAQTGISIVSGTNKFLTFVDDNIGIGQIGYYWNGNMNFLTDGAERMIISSTGNVSIGTSTTASARFNIQSTSTSDILNLFETGGQEVFTVLESGNVGIGTTSPSAKLDIYGTAGNNHIFAISSSTNTRLITVDAKGQLLLGTTDESFITNSGFGAGIVRSPGSDGMSIRASSFSQAGAFNRRDTDSTSRENVGLFRNGVQVGSINTTNVATSYNTTSDRRKKQDIATTTLGLETLLKIPVRDFSFIDDETHSLTTGFIAQELYEIFPYAVSTNGDNGVDPLTGELSPWSVDYGRVTPLVVKAIQDLNLKLEDMATTTAISEILNASSTETGTSTEPIIESFTKRFFQNVIAWFADSMNGIGDFFAGRVRTEELCVGEEGNETCITKDQLDALLINADQQGNGGSPEPEPEPTPEEEVVPEDEEETEDIEERETEEETPAEESEEDTPVEEQEEEIETEEEEQVETDGGDEGSTEETPSNP